MLEYPKCLFCEIKLPYRDLITQFRYTWVFGGKKYNKPRERVWTCKKCRLRVQASLDAVSEIVNQVFGKNE